MVYEDKNYGRYEMGEAKAVSVEKTDYLQSIINGAPDETATHVDDFNVYYRFVSDMQIYEVYRYRRGVFEWHESSPVDDLRKLSDLKEIVRLRGCEK